MVEITLTLSGLAVLACYLFDKFYVRRGLYGFRKYLDEHSFMIRSTKNGYKKFQKFMTDFVIKSDENRRRKEISQIIPLTILLMSRKRVISQLFGEFDINYVPGDILPSMSDSLSRFSYSILAQDYKEAYLSFRDFIITIHYFKDKEGRLTDTLPLASPSDDAKKEFSFAMKEACEQSRSQIKLSPIGDECEKWRNRVAIWESQLNDHILDPDVLLLHLVITDTNRILRSYSPEFLGQSGIKEIETYTKTIEKLLENLNDKDSGALFKTIVKLDNFIYDVSENESLPKA